MLTHHVYQPLIVLSAAQSLSGEECVTWPPYRITNENTPAKAALWGRSGSGYVNLLV